MSQRRTHRTEGPLLPPPDDAEDFLHPGAYPDNPEAELWRAVLERAIRDYTTICTNYPRSREHVAEFFSGEWWWSRQVGTFRYICEVLSARPVVLRDKVLRHIEAVEPLDQVLARVAVGERRVC